MGVATAAVVLFAVPLAVVLRSSYRDEELARLQRDTIAATRTIDVSASVEDEVELPPSSDSLAVYDRDGRLVAGEGAAVADELVRLVQDEGRSTQTYGDGQLTVAVPLLSGERIGGVVRASRSDAAVEARTHAAWLRLAGLAAGLVGIAGLAAFVLGRRLAHPLESLAVSAQRLGDGDFAARSPRSGVAEVDAVGSALNTTARRLDELLARERAFSADASHQLRTPVSALRIELEAMEMAGDPTPELNAALGQVDRLQATIETLLNAARDRPQRANETDLRRVIEEALPRWRGRLGDHGRQLTTVVQCEVPLGAASPTVVSEILDVLVSNADRHGKGEVTVTVRDTSGGVAIDVSDEGAGLHGEPEDVFVRRSATGDGHGIGLALARSLAQAEGARLVVSDPGPRPVFTLLLARSTSTTLT